MSDISNVMNHAPSFPVAGPPVPLVCVAPVDGAGDEASRRILEISRGTVAGLYIALRAKHPPAATHSMRVAFWGSAWGLKHGLDDSTLSLIESLALLHEIGKIGIPERLLQKSDRLHESEQHVIDMHSDVGFEILHASGSSETLLKAFQQVTLLHSPRPAAGVCEAAMIAGRLVRIISAFDSRLSEKPPHGLSAQDYALAEILEHAGTRYDPALAKSFAELILTASNPLKERVSQRWISELAPPNFSRYFKINPSKMQDRSGSVLVQSLNETFYRHMIDHIHNGVIFIDAGYRILDWNSAAERLTGRVAQTALHQTWSPAIANLCDTEGYPLDESNCPFRGLMVNGATGKQRLAIRSSEGRITQISVDVVPVISDRGDLCGGAMLIDDVSETTELEKTITLLHKRACIDPLTNLANRGELNSQLPQFLEYHQSSVEPGSVIICDIDYFKKINDTFSHQAGDEALVVFAQLLKETCRESDFVARFGGEEFVVLCGQCALSEAKKLADTIRVKLQRTPIPALRNQCLTASFGVATIQPEDTADSVLNRADRGLLIAKENGRDRVVALGDSEERPTSPESAEKRPWWKWLTASNVKTLRSELITNVPRAVTLEKLKGFVHEIQAVVHHVDQNHLILVIDCKNAPIPKLKDERLSKFRVTIEIADVEMRVNGDADNLKVCTLLDVEISAIRTRDRRTDSLRNQANRLKTSLQGYLVAHEIDEYIQQDIVRKFKASNESRY